MTVPIPTQDRSMQQSPSPSPSTQSYLPSSFSSSHAHVHGNSHNTKTIAGYTLLQKLGSGSFATVYKAFRTVPVPVPSTSTSTSTLAIPSSSNSASSYNSSNSNSSSSSSSSSHEYVAIKAIARKSEKITKKVLENLELEISILSTNKHPNIVCLHQAHKTDRHFYLILEYCAGGDLQHLIRTRKSGRITERLVRRLMRDLTAGLLFLASHKIIHRDIKPQNLLLTGPLPFDELHDPARLTSQQLSQQQQQTQGQGQQQQQCTSNIDSDSVLQQQQPFHLKIADFGFARHLQKTSLADTLCGSPLYMAPEILQNQRYNNKADLWSAGTVLFEMITGRPPFHGENHIDLLRNIQQKSVRLPPDLKVSRECVKLLRILLNRNPLKRATFPDFVKASNDFVALGCNGSSAGGSGRENGSASASSANASGNGNTCVENGTGNSNSTMGEQGLETNTISSPTATAAANNLGPISEVEESHLHSSTHMDRESDGNGNGNGSANEDGDGNVNNTNTKSNIPCSSEQLLPFQQQQTQPQTQSQQQVHTQMQQHHNNTNTRPYYQFTPLEPSPPGPTQMSIADAAIPPPMSLRSGSSGRALVHGTGIGTSIGTGQQQQQYSHLGPDHPSHPYNTSNMNMYHRRNDSLQHSDDSSSGGFVMVEKGSSPNNNNNNNSTGDESGRAFSRSPLTIWKQSSSRRVVPVSALNGHSHSHSHGSPPASPRSNSSRFFTSKTILSSRSLIPPSIPFVKKGGILSTSPGTGGALVGLMGARAGNGKGGLNSGIGGASAGSSNGSDITHSNSNNNNSVSSNFVNIECTAKMLSAADDVGRRAINVAHVGDTRAFLAMKLLVSNETSNSSLFGNSTSVPMEGVEEGGTSHDSSSNSSYPNRVRTVSTDRSWSRRGSGDMEFGDHVDADHDGNSHDGVDDNDEDDEMPFAMPFEEDDVVPSSTHHEGAESPYCNSKNLKKTNAAVVKTSNSSILSYFREALSCYVKALTMLKGSVNASQQILSELNRTSSNCKLFPDMESFQQFKSRCEVSHNWLTGQFRGVLDRADAANAEITRLSNIIRSENDSSLNTTNNTVTSVEELIYNHSLACGKDGAVKQLLGQFEAARACYRSAGLLAETLLMEPKLGEEDKKILEEYVLSFSERINEIDYLMLQQSRQSASSSTRGGFGSAPSSRKSSTNSIVPMVGR